MVRTLLAAMLLGSGGVAFAQTAPAPTAAPAPAPSAEAERLGMEVARSGLFAGLLPVIEAKETAETIAETPGLTEAEQTQLKAIARRIYAGHAERLFAALGKAYAAKLSVEDLRTVAAFNRSPAADRYRAAEPLAVAAAMQALGGVDARGDTRKAFCAETGKGCAKK